MYLKSIEIQGFKSFANRIVFEFHNGVTGIVGPNGSGKSNVADAVRWVLGEQSAKQLRGGSMQDVIFSGTEQRKPQGFAFVAITLDNSDHVLAVSYDEVTVSRRLYRSGESEYKINGTSCRLKDINELFFDTGIGKEGYSIIGQGQIDQILSGKPEERRALLDEAAGIVKFRRRKAEAQKKLDDEQANLVRINDILSELEKRVDPLKGQAEKAKKYLELREQLKVYDVNLFLTETKSLREQYTEAEKRENTVEERLAEVKAAAEEKRAEHQKLADEAEALDREIAEGDEASKNAELEIRSLEGRRDVLTQQIAGEKQAESQVDERLHTVTDDLRKHRDEAETAKKQQEAYAHEAAGSAEAIAGAEQALAEASRAAAEKEAEIEKAREAIISSLGKKAQISAEKQRFATRLEEMSSRQEENATRIERYRSDETAGSEELADCRRRLAENERALAGAAEKIRTLRDQSAAEEEEIRRLNRALSGAQQEYHIADTRRESLRNMAERYDGYGSSIRRVMEQRGRVPGILGVVADLISTDRRYETAIETALGGQIQNIVTDSELTAKRMIGFLKQNRFGRATFLPLTSMREREGGRPVTGQGVIGMADTLVRTEPRYRGVISQLLGRTVVADNIDSAIALNRANHYSLRIVTLDGELLNPGGSMTGGAFRNSSNLLGRKRELEDLENACAKALEKVEKLQQSLVNTEEQHERTAEEADEAGKDSQKLTIENRELAMQLKQAEEKREELKKTFAGLKADSADLQAEIGKLREMKADAERAEQEIDEQNGSLSEKAESLGMELSRLRESREEAEQSLSEKRVEDSRLRQKGEFLRQNAARLAEEIRSLEAEEKSLREKNSGRGDRVAGFSRELQEIGARMEERTRELAGLKQKTDGLREEKAGKAGQQRAFFEEKEKLDEEMRLLDRDLLRIQNQLEKYADRISQQSDYIRTEYGMEHDDAEKLRDEDLGSAAAMRREISARKGEIRALGNVNVNAIEEYKEVSERCTFMEKQHADLVAAEAALTRIITELDEGMRKQFTEKFRRISEEFDQVFKELFGGGTASLKLEEGVDVLEAGIGIISQPPGKKLQNMMQLSGGEKALTAIALLFAIQNLKPSPFCLLDEIEAALDDSNVDRFAGYLHKLTSHTQFIVITHRRGTMLGCDRLYGITMQEKGVSTMVSVNLIAADLEGEEKHGRD